MLIRRWFPLFYRWIARMRVLLVITICLFPFLILLLKLHTVSSLPPKSKRKRPNKQIIPCGIISQKWKQVLTMEEAASVIIVAKIMHVIVIFVELAL